MAEEVSHLFGGEGVNGSIRLFDAVDQIGGEGVAEGMKSSLLQPSRFQDAVISFPEVYRPGIASVFIRDEGLSSPKYRSALRSRMASTAA